MAECNAHNARSEGGSLKPTLESSDDFPFENDGVQRLWTPGRMVYINGESKPKDTSEEQCPFCAALEKSDEESLIIWRGTHCFAIMNLFPYNVGHLMVLPKRHVSLLTQLSDIELFEFEKVSALALEVMKEVSHPDGWNFGINQGKVAGAGVAGHLHQHVVPRWEGDSNFMPITAGTRTMPVLLGQQRDDYAQAFKRLASVRNLPVGNQITLRGSEITLKSGD
jgi:ATP adenylyltransferase